MELGKAFEGCFLLSFSFLLIGNCSCHNKTIKPHFRSQYKVLLKPSLRSNVFVKFEQSATAVCIVAASFVDELKYFPLKVFFLGCPSIFRNTVLVWMAQLSAPLLLSQRSRMKAAESLTSLVKLKISATEVVVLYFARCGAAISLFSVARISS